MAHTELSVVLSLKSNTVGIDQVNAKLKEMGVETSTVEQKHTAVQSSLAKYAASAITIGTVTAAFRAMVSTGSEFNQKIAEISTLSGASADELKKLKQGALDLQIPFDNLTITDALYQAQSAGVAFGDSLEFVKEASQLAVAGNTDVLTSVDGLTSVINAYGDSMTNAQAYSDAMFVAVKDGKTTVGELASTLGGIAPLANTAGISFDELTGAVAATTKNGIATSEAVTGIKAALTNIIKPTKEASDTAEELGLKFDTQALASKGLAGFLADVREKTGGNVETMSMLFGSVEALNTVMALSAQDGATLNAILEDMEGKSGATAEAFAKMDTAKNSWALFLKEIDSIQIKMFGEVDSGLSSATQAVTGYLHGISEEIVSGFGGFTTVATNFGTLVVDTISDISSIFGGLFSAINSQVSNLTLFDYFLLGMQSVISGATIIKNDLERIVYGIAANFNLGWANILEGWNEIVILGLKSGIEGLNSWLPDALQIDLSGLTESYKANLKEISASRKDAYGWAEKSTKLELENVAAAGDLVKLYNDLNTKKDENVIAQTGVTSAVNDTVVAMQKLTANSTVSPKLDTQATQQMKKDIDDVEKYLAQVNEKTADEINKPYIQLTSKYDELYEKAGENTDLRSQLDIAYYQELENLNSSTLEKITDKEQKKQTEEQSRQKKQLEDWVAYYESIGDYSNALQAQESKLWIEHKDLLSRLTREEQEDFIEAQKEKIIQSKKYVIEGDDSFIGMWKNAGKSIVSFFEGEQKKNFSNAVDSITKEADKKIDDRQNGLLASWKDAGEDSVDFFASSSFISSFGGSISASTKEANKKIDDTNNGLLASWKDAGEDSVDFFISTSYVSSFGDSISASTKEADKRIDDTDNGFLASWNDAGETIIEYLGGENGLKNSISSTLESGIVNIFSGKVDSIADFFSVDNLGKTITGHLVNIAAKVASEKITMFFTNAWAGGDNTGKGFVENFLGIDIPFLNFAKGTVWGSGKYGIVDGIAPFSGDDLRNDKVAAVISEGEAVIPRSAVAANRGVVEALIRGARLGQFADGYINGFGLEKAQFDSSSGVFRLKGGGIPIVSDVVDAVSNVVSGAGKVIGDVGAWIDDSITRPVANVVQDIGQFAWNSVVKPVMTTLMENPELAWLAQAGLAAFAPSAILYPMLSADLFSTGLSIANGSNLGDALGSAGISGLLAGAGAGLGYAINGLPTEQLYGWQAIQSYPEEMWNKVVTNWTELKQGLSLAGQEGADEFVWDAALGQFVEASSASGLESVLNGNILDGFLKVGDYIYDYGIDAFQGAYDYLADPSKIFQYILDNLSGILTNITTSISSVAGNPLIAALVGNGITGNNPLGLNLGVHAFGEGGVVTAPTFGLIGETGQDEAIIPLSDAGIAVLGMAQVLEYIKKAYFAVQKSAYLNEHLMYIRESITGMFGLQEDSDSFFSILQKSVETLVDGATRRNDLLWDGNNEMSTILSGIKTNITDSANTTTTMLSQGFSSLNEAFFNGLDAVASSLVLIGNALSTTLASLETQLENARNQIDAIAFVGSPMALPLGDINRPTANSFMSDFGISGFADGIIALGPTLGVFGEKPGVPELALPLDRFGEISGQDRLAEKVDILIEETRQMKSYMLNMARAMKDGNLISAMEAL